MENFGSNFTPGLTFCKNKGISALLKGSNLPNWLQGKAITTSPLCPYDVTNSFNYLKKKEYHITLYLLHLYMPHKF